MRKQLHGRIGDGVDLVVAAVQGTQHVTGVERVEIVQHELPGQALLHDLSCRRCLPHGSVLNGTMSGSRRRPRARLRNPYLLKRNHGVSARKQAGAFALLRRGPLIIHSPFADLGPRAAYQRI
jgi:hypothetical protein